MRSLNPQRVFKGREFDVDSNWRTLLTLIRPPGDCIKYQKGHFSPRAKCQPNSIVRPNEAMLYNTSLQAARLNIHLDLHERLYPFGWSIHYTWAAHFNIYCAEEEDVHRDCGDTARKTKFLKLRGRWASLNSGYPPRVSFHPKLCGCDFPRCSKRFMRGPSTAWEALNYLGFAILCRVRFWKEDRKRSYKSLILRLNSFSNLLNMEPRRCSDSLQPLISFPPPILRAARQWIKHRRANLRVHVQAITALLSLHGATQTPETSSRESDRSV